MELDQYFDIATAQILEDTLWQFYSTHSIFKSSTNILLYVMTDSQLICAVHAPYYNEIVVDADDVVLP
jgi:hypothetical protein